MNRSVVAFGGHIGDMDLTAGPTLAKLVLEGANATIVALTYGERGHPRLSPAEYKVQKLAEGRRSRRRSARTSLPSTTATGSCRTPTRWRSSSPRSSGRSSRTP